MTPGDERKRASCGSPRSQTKWSRSKIAQATPGAPVASLQLRQWQRLRAKGAASTRNLPAPHRQPPAWRLESGDIGIAMTWTLEPRPQVPQLGEEPDVEPPAQIRDPRGAAGAGAEADDPLDRRHVAEAPLADEVLEVDQLLGQLV